MTDEIIYYNGKDIKHEDNNANLLSLYTHKIMKLPFKWKQWLFCKYLAPITFFIIKVRSREFYSINCIRKTSSCMLLHQL